MLTELKIANFRGFSDEVTIRLKPITLLIGHNNSSKSSVMKLLLMLKQSCNPASLEFLATSGDAIKLPSLYAQKNVRTKREHLKFAVKFKDADSTGDVIKSFLQKQKKGPEQKVAEQKNSQYRDIHYILDASVRYAKDRASRGKVALSIEHGKECVTPYENAITDDLRMFNLVGSLPDTDGRAKEDDVDESLKKLGIFLRLVNPAKEDDVKEFVEKLGSFFRLMDSVQEDDAEEIVKKLGSFLRLIDSTDDIRVSEYCNRLIVQDAGNISYISPEIMHFERAFPKYDPRCPDREVGSDGEWTLHQLHKIYKDRPDAFGLVCRHLKDILGVSKITFDEHSDRELVACQATNLKTNAHTNIADFGFGTNQCLPTLVQGAIMHPYSTLMVEEPEANLHLTAQLDMANFFVELWNTCKVASIIETHSANMLLRLRNKIIKGELDCRDISVAYFATDNHKTTVKNLNINKKGILDDGLPREFFHKDFWEVMDMNT